MPSAEAGGQEHGQAYRCSMCSLNFPRTREFSSCPVCGESCTGYSNVAAMAEDEANSILYHARFERYYAEEHEPSLELTEEEEVMVELAVLSAKEARLRREAEVAGRVESRT